MTKGYAGKILRVDLTKSQITTEEPPDSFYRRYMGGSALNMYYLLKEMVPRVDAFSPDNILAFSVSALTGVQVAGLSRLTVTAKSPLTDAIGDSQSGGYFPAKLKFAGFDAVIVKGKAASPVYLWIDNGQVELRDATHLWGRTTGDVETAIFDEVADERDVEVLQIGPAGEKGVRYASIMSMCSRANGRTGMGAVMGSKNLKAIAVRGSEKPSIANADALKEVVRAGAQGFKNKGIQGFGKYGTTSLVAMQSGVGGLPTRNWQSGVFDAAEQIDGRRLYKEFLQGAEEGKQESRGRDSCFGCMIRCKRVTGFDTGTYSVDPKFGGPEYETLAALGSYCGIDDLPAVCKANELCNKYGIDTISCGATISWAMETFESGRLTTEHTDGMELRFGDTEAMLRLVEMIGEREGFGNVLAEGSARVAEKFGVGEEFLTASKKMEAPAHMPHMKKAYVLMYAVNPFGADHMSSEGGLQYTEKVHEYFQEQLGASGLPAPSPVNVLQPEKIEFVRLTQKMYSFMDSANMCMLVWGINWSLYGPQNMVDLIRAVTGWDVSLAEILEIGERRLVMMKLFNAREGIGAEEDNLPAKFFHSPLVGGPTDGVTVDEEELKSALTEYYRQCGWDELTGDPSADTLTRLGLDMFK